jgi:C4-type Zn-finger protein
MSSVRYVTGEPVKIEETTSFVDRLIEGDDIVTVRATDTDGNSAEGTARSREEAEDKAIYKLESNK